MAILQMEDGSKLTDLQSIIQELAPLGITLNYWSIGDNPELHHLLSQDSLDDAQKETVLTHLDHYFNELASTGYTSRDLIVLHPEVPNLDTMLSKFDKIHTHADDEVRYIVAGEGIFGFVRPDGSQVELTVQPQEYINVPAGTQHWFILTPAKRVKAVRYFCGTAGWVPKYTDIQIRVGRQVASV
ncbi:acireductone dioxygenase [Dulcicalothrix desertica PCC 7102]|uniref:Acireductone dioxygenase n=1 Tax=Dulcicalothrix desertica PCC 7102 TaxID=232991 RepID=A0A433UU62_9CYAN|nr:cupin domain-containing protein [Dulcicalothrix desertica]RUS97356.1 acireductone dioxygenase [Dulcicalothrix desertica PCC 7102]TWH55535.1 1,2-dihydroxy-3-keto-5-methylthiopentene dioxygenase [Dulcicalothrix desertica PCC 7102]